MLAERLGWNLCDHRIIDEVARRLELPEAEVEATEEQPSSFLEQLLTALGSASIEFSGAGEVPAWAPPFEQGALDTRKAVLRITQEVIREAARGDAVIVGRGAGYILRDHPNALHILAQGSTDYRTRSVMETLGLPIDEAGRRVKEMDANRGAAIKQLYGHDWLNAGHYDLVLDTGRLGFAGTVETVLTAARSKLS